MFYDLSFEHKSTYLQTSINNEKYVRVYGALLPASASAAPARGRRRWGMARRKKHTQQIRTQARHKKQHNYFLLSAHPPTHTHTHTHQPPVALGGRKAAESHRRS
jgi:hypothetical protein